jgi:hypothetical protein
MTVETSSKRPLTEINHLIEQAEAEAARLQKEHAAVRKDVARAKRRLQYLRLARLVRKPAPSVDNWRMAALLVGPGIIGALALVMSLLVFNSATLSLLIFLLSLAAGFAAFAALLYRPTDDQLGPALAEAEAKSRLEDARLSEKTDRLTEANERLNKLIDERRDQVASGKLQRAALLQRPWKSMRGPEWEDFIVEVCRTHGAKVHRTGRTAADDANLVADFGSRRVAIFTEGEGHNVASSTVQAALAAKGRHACQSCAIIINRRFTGAAQDYASCNGCAAIGASEFPDFVLGKITL